MSEERPFLLKAAAPCLHKSLVLQAIDLVGDGMKLAKEEGLRRDLSELGIAHGVVMKIAEFRAQFLEIHQIPANRHRPRGIGLMQPRRLAPTQVRGGGRIFVSDVPQDHARVVFMLLKNVARTVHETVSEIAEIALGHPHVGHVRHHIDSGAVAQAQEILF